MTLPVTIHFTEDEAHKLLDLLEWAANDIEERLPDCKDDPELSEIWPPLYNITVLAIEKIEATITENHIMGEPGQCPDCKNTHWATMEQTGADAHCDHQEERNFSCSNCGCRFDEVWAYSHKEVTRRGGENLIIDGVEITDPTMSPCGRFPVKQCECDEPERETRDGGRSVICTACGRDAS